MRCGRFGRLYLQLIMKTLSRYAFAVSALLLTLFSCSESEELSVSLEVRPDTITADGKSQAKFAVYEGKAEVTSEAMIYNLEKGELMKGSTFSTTIPGKYSFYAEYDGKRTETVEVVAEELTVSSFVKKVCLMEFTDSDCLFCPNAMRFISLVILQDNENVHLMAFHERDQWKIEQYSELAARFKITSTPNSLVDMRDVCQFTDQLSDIVDDSFRKYPSHCGVAISSDITESSSAEVSVKLYSEKVMDYYLAVYIVEDGIIGPQKDNAHAGNDHVNPEYYHKYVTRRLVSSTIYGDYVGRVPSKTEKTLDYKVAIDPAWNLEKTYVYALAMDEEGHVNNMQVCPLGTTADYEYKK